MNKKIVLPFRKILKKIERSACVVFNYIKKKIGILMGKNMKGRPAKSQACNFKN